MSRLRPVLGTRMGEHEKGFFFSSHEMMRIGNIFRLGMMFGCLRALGTYVTCVPGFSMRNWGLIWRLGWGVMDDVFGRHSSLHCFLTFLTFWAYFCYCKSSVQEQRARAARAVRAARRASVEINIADAWHQHGLCVYRVLLWDSTNGTRINQVPGTIWTSLPQY